MSTSKLLRAVRGLLAGVALAVAFGSLTASPAAATTTNLTVIDWIHYKCGTLDTQTYSSAAGGYKIVRGGNVGYCRPGTYIVHWQWSDRRWETFVVGTNSVPYRSNQHTAGGTAWSAWTSMGGKVNSAASSGLWFNAGLAQLEVLGTDNYSYCNQANPTWTGWKRC